MARGQRRVIWSEEALHALDEALEYIAKDAPKVPGWFLSRLLRRLQV